MKKLFPIIIAIYLLPLQPHAQVTVPEALKLRLQDKTKFESIREEVLNYYQQESARFAANDTTHKRLINRQLKFWNRYFYWAEMHLDKNGEVIKDMSSRALNAVNNPAVPVPDAVSAFGAWSSVGPSYAPDGVGRVNRIAFHPTNAGVIYAGTANGGLWRLIWIGSTYTWTCLTNYIPELSISGIVVSKADPNTIYILTGDGDESGGFVSSWGYRGSSIGVLKSTDGGNNWFATTPFPFVTAGSYRGMSLIQDPNNANTLLAATTNGIFRTTNGGNSWVRSQMGSVDDDDIAFDIEYKPGSSNIAYAIYRKANGSADFFLSVNGGLNFELRSMINSGVNRAAIAVTPANPDYVYAIFGPGRIVDGNSSNNTFNGSFFSSNSGVSFSQQTLSPDILGNITASLILGHQSSYDMALAASSVNASIVMAGGLVVWKSEDKGITFDEMTDYWPSDPDDDDCIHPDVHDLAYNPLDGRLYAATDGGVSVSADNGDHFGKLFSGLQIGQFYHFEASNEDGLVWGGTQDCGVLLQESGTSYELYAGGDGYDVLTDKSGNNDDSYYVVNQKIRDDSPAGFDDITPDFETEFFPLIALHPVNEDIMYAGYTSRLYISQERGDNWQRRGSTSIPTSARWAIGICPSNGARVYCAGAQSADVRGMWRIENVTSDDNFTVNNLRSTLVDSGYTLGRKITGIAVNPSNSAQVWISIAGNSGEAKVMFSANGGSTWVNKTGSLPDSIPATAIITDAASNVYVGTDIGVYYRGSSMNDWTPFYNGLPRVAISGLQFLTVGNVQDPINPFRYLYASTFGRGIWRSEIFGNCSPTLSLTQTLGGQQFYQVSRTLTSSSRVTGGAGTTVNFQSGYEINLTTGFESSPNILFHGYLRGCNTGPLPGERTAIFKDSLQKIKQSLPGLVEAVVSQNNGVSITLKLNQAGSYSLHLFTQNRELVKTLLPETSYQPGRNTLQFTSTDIPKGFYHVVLLQNGRELHFQEWTVE